MSAPQQHSGNGNHADGLAAGSGLRPGSAKPGSFRERGGAWVLGQSGLMLLVLALGPLSAGSGPWVGGAWPGWVFCGLGAGVGVAGAWVLGRNRTIFPRPHSDSRLVQHGIYRAVRHPLYVSVMSLSLGWAWLWQSLPALLVAGLLGVLLDRKARREEVWLAGQFPGYGDYARRVRRFVPWLY